MIIEEEIIQNPNLDLAQTLYEYDICPSKVLSDIIQEQLKKNHMLPLYENLRLKYGWVLDESLQSEMKEKNAADLARRGP